MRAKSIYQKMADEVVAGKPVTYSAATIEELRDFQRRIHTYGNYRGYRLTTTKIGMDLQVRTLRPMLPREIVKLWLYRPSVVNKFRAGRQN